MKSMYKNSQEITMLFLNTKEGKEEMQKYTKEMEAKGYNYQKEEQVTLKDSKGFTASATLVYYCKFFNDFEVYFNN